MWTLSGRNVCSHNLVDVDILAKCLHSGRLNTAFIERVNLTVRHGVAALARRTWATAQQNPQLLAHLQWWRAYYHFVRPHAALRVALVQPRERGASWWHNATGSVLRRWQQGELIDDGQRRTCSVIPLRLAMPNYLSVNEARRHPRNGRR